MLHFITTAGSLLKVLPSEDVAVVNFLRHCEKTPESGTGCSIDGIHRAQYLAKCMSSNATSAVLPIRKPAKVIASQDIAGLSHRPHDTALPLAETLSMDVHQPCGTLDKECLADELQRQLFASETIVVVWQHENIPALLAGLEVPGADAYRSWPYECDASSWPEPKACYGSSRCYDVVWQVTFTRPSLRLNNTISHSRWIPRLIQTHRQGFLGSPTGECTGGLEPELREQPVVIFM
jgi:hypothetical protein